MGAISKNPNSHFTAKERTKLSFPAKVLLERGLLQGRVLDYGCGLGKDVEELKKKGIDVVAYDPHYFPNNPHGKFDTILCIYVLNVLLPVERSEVLVDISTRLSEDGTAYYAVRRDIKFEGFRRHKKHGVQTYQCLVHLPFPSIFINDFTEIYRYEHFTNLSSKENQDCPFCQTIDGSSFILESHTAFAIFDRFPVSSGHALIIPKRHTPDYFSLNKHEQRACWYLVEKVKDILEKEFQPDGYNVGINVGATAGQTVPHVHIHLIPRYNGDQADPTGGVRGVIPDKKNYMKDE